MRVSGNFVICMDYYLEIKKATTEGHLGALGFVALQDHTLTHTQLVNIAKALVGKREQLRKQHKQLVLSRYY